MAHNVVVPSVRLDDVGLPVMVHYDRLGDVLGDGHGLGCSCCDTHSWLFKFRGTLFKQLKGVWDLDSLHSVFVGAVMSGIVTVSCVNLLLSSLHLSSRTNSLSAEDFRTFLNESVVGVKILILVDIQITCA